MKFNKTLKKSISIILTVIMIFSMMTVGMISVNAGVPEGVWLVDSSGSSTDWPGGHDCTSHKLVLNNTTNKWEHTYKATTNTTVTLYIKNQYSKLDQYSATGGSSFNVTDSSKTYTLSSGYNPMTFMPEVGATYKFEVSNDLKQLTITKTGGSSSGEDTVTVIPKNIYLNAGGTTYWDHDGARIVAKFYSGSKTSYVEGIKLTDGTFMFVNENQYENVTFLRKNPTGFVLNNDTCWNSVSGQTVPINGDNYFTLKSYTSGSWGTYTGTWYVTGRFAVKGSDGQLDYAATNADNYNWADFKTSDLPMTKVSSTEYTLDTGLTIQEMTALYDLNPSTAADAKTVWYFQFANGSSKYRPSTSAIGTLTADRQGTEIATTTSGDFSFVFDENATSTGTVTLHFNPSTHKFWFTLSGDTPPTEKTWYAIGRFAVKNADGTLTWTADNDTHFTQELTSNLQFTKESENLYKLATGFKMSELAEYNNKEYGGGKWYLSFADGEKNYSCSETEFYFTDDKAGQANAVTLNSVYSKAVFFTGSSDKLVTIWLDTTDASAPKVYFTLEEKVVKTTKEEYVASKDAALWFDAAPSKTELTTTLIKWNNKDGASGTKNNEYVLYIPRDVAHNGNTITVTLYNGYDKDLVIQNVDTIPAKGSKEVTLTNGATYPTSGAKDTNVKVMQGSSASIFFHTTNKDGTADYNLPTKTDGSLTSKSKVEAKGGECVTLDGSNLSDVMKLSSVKGRGNSSWKASYQVFGKYAYNMKLKAPTNLLELPMSKSYCLLANNADESMLRNALTYDLAKKVGLYDSPEFKFVDMYDNGEYHGTYFICEKVDVGEDKLIPGEAFDDINEDKIGKDVIDAAAEDKNNYKETTYSFNNQSHRMQYLKTGNNNTTGVPYNTRGTYLLEFEIEERYDDEIAWFVSPQGQEVVVKSPENATEEQVRYIAQKFAEMEAVVYNSASTLDNMKNHIDVDSFAKMYLIQELSSNLDSAATSYYITFDCSKGADARFIASPVWDYDWAYGQYDSTTAYRRYDKYGNEIFTSQEEGWFAKNKAMGDGRSSTVGKRNLQGELASHSAFQPVIKKAWNNGFYSNVQTYANTTLDTWKGQIAGSMAMNENRWHFIADDLIKTWGSKDTGDTLADAVTFLKNWLLNRSAWLNTEIQKYESLTEETVNVPEVVNKTQNEAVTLLENAGLKYSVVEVYNDATKGTVISSDPEAGETVAKGSIVKITVSLGQKPMVTVPDVVGENKANAITQLKALGLVVKVTTQSSDVEAGKVISSTPGKDESVEIGTEVTIVVSTGPVEKETISNVKIRFKGTNLKNLTPKFTFNGETVEISRLSKNDGGYIGTYFTGAYGFYWWEATLDSVTVGEDNVLKFTTTGSDMNASLTYDFAGCESECELYFAVDNMYSGTELVNITDNNTARFTFRSAGNMVSNANYAEDPTPSRVMLSLLDAAGVATTKTYTVGDTNADGNVNIKDATLAQMMTAGIVSGSDTNNLLGDYDISGDVNIKDATGIQSYIVNY